MAAKAFQIQCSRNFVTPSTAPKQFFNIKHIRQNPSLYSQNSVLRNYKHLKDNPYKIVRLYDERKELQRASRAIREKSNSLNTQLSQRKTSSDPGGLNDESKEKDDLLEEARELKKQRTEVESQETSLDNEIDTLASELPNLTSAETPSPEDAGPQLKGHVNTLPLHDPKTLSRRNHVHLGLDFGLLEFESASIGSGWGWYYLDNEAALLSQALIAYALSVGMQHGFTVSEPPSMVYTHIASATGFRPRDQHGEQQVYTIEQTERASKAGKPQRCLTGTAEIPFAVRKASTTMQEKDLPFRLIGLSRCYRAEAGARGVDSKGLYRVHEFTKVEMFGWTLPGKSKDLFHTMLAIQSQILGDLGLFCRILEMPPKDLGASAYRKQDIEAYFPSRKDRDEGFGEVTSTSMCTDYQTRRLDTRVKMKSGETDFPHTVNGTALAVPRVLAALIENCWDDIEDVIRIPKVLWPFMHGIKEIRKKK